MNLSRVFIHCRASKGVHCEVHLARKSLPKNSEEKSEVSCCSRASYFGADNGIPTKFLLPKQTIIRRKWRGRVQVFTTYCQRQPSTVSPEASGSQGAQTNVIIYQIILNNSNDAVRNSAMDPTKSAIPHRSCPSRVIRTGRNRASDRIPGFVSTKLHREMEYQVEGCMSFESMLSIRSHCIDTFPSVLIDSDILL